MEKEIWVDIKEFNGEYKISNLGRVNSVKSDLIMKLNCLNQHRFFHL